MPDLDPADQQLALDLDRAHVFHSWSAQGALNPQVFAGGAGARLWDFEGNEYLDMSSQLVNVNIGYQHPKLVKAIADYAQQMTTIQPAFANDDRSEAARLITEVAGHDLNQVFFTNAGAEANENAIRLARLHTGRPKVLAMYRSYHGATHGVIGLTGDPRRWGTEPHTIPGVVHFWGPYPYRSAFHSSSAEEETTRALQHLRDTIMVEGAGTIAPSMARKVEVVVALVVPHARPLSAHDHGRVERPLRRPRVEHVRPIVRICRRHIAIDVGDRILEARHASIVSEDGRRCFTVCQRLTTIGFLWRTS